jgi:hypothetical protein
VVGGLERFRDHFKEHVHQYALIGGSACDLLMEQAGLTFRATKDLDIVLIVEELDAGFGRSCWQFIRAGRYAVAQSGEGKSTYYRFVSPRAAGFPSMLEVLSIRPEGIPPSEDVHITPIPFDEGISSLSAILLQEEYYAFLKAGIRLVDGISVVGPEHLVPLKARLARSQGTEGGRPRHSQQRHQQTSQRRFQALPDTRSRSQEGRTPEHPGGHAQVPRRGAQRTCRLEEPRPCQKLTGRCAGAARDHL